MKRTLQWAPIAFGVIFLLALGFLQRDRALRGQNDFAQLYAGAKLAGTPDLYSRSANLAVIGKNTGITMETVVYTRPPFYAALLKPLSWMPYLAAYALFSLVTFGCALWFVLRFAEECPALPTFAAMSIPILTALCGGQDTPLLLAVLGGSILLMRANKDGWAGLLLSLVAIKFHLFLFIPIFLLVKRRWSILGGALAGTLLLSGFGVAVAGADSLKNYIAVLRDPWINPSATIMPNLHGLVAVLGSGATLELVLTGAVVAAFVWVVWRSDRDEFLLAVSLVCGLLVSFHSGVADDVLLLLSFVAILRTCSMHALRAAMALILTPIPYFMVLSDAPYSAFLPICLLFVLGLCCFAVTGENQETVVARQALADAHL